VVSIVDIAEPQNLIEAWGKNAAFHFVFADIGSAVGRQFLEYVSASALASTAAVSSLPVSLLQTS
jgi:hypothetical protein